MKVADIEIGGIYAVKEGSYPSPGTISFSTIYRARVIRIEKLRLSERSSRLTTYVVVEKLRHVDDTPLYGTASEDRFVPQMVLAPWDEYRANERDAR